MQLKLRFFYLLVILILIPIGLASRAYDSELPFLYGNYAPDVWWATVIYLGLRFLGPERPMKVAVLTSLLISFSIEVSQFYHAPWIDAIRDTTLGGLILGFSFLWSDLFCYSLGIFIGYWADRTWISGGESSSRRDFQVFGVEK